jgi:hypothetical protein
MDRWPHLYGIAFLPNLAEGLQISDRETKIVQDMWAEASKLLEEKKHAERKNVMHTIHDNQTGSDEDPDEVVVSVSGQIFEPRNREDDTVRMERVKTRRKFPNGEEMQDTVESQHTIAVDGPHRLCVPCLDAIEHLLCNDDIAVLHHFNLESLHLSASLECRICKVVDLHIANRIPDTPETRENARIEVYKAKSRSGVYSDSHQYLIFSIVRTDLPQTVGNLLNLYMLHVWPEETYASCFALPFAEPIATHLKDSDHTGSPQSRSLSRYWLDMCKANKDGTHHLCNRSDGTWLPTRLLDVRGAVEEGVLRLVVCEKEPQRFASDESKNYITFSYCWGKFGAAFLPLLKTTNLERRQREGLPVNSLPKTFRHAIEIASWFDGTYLISYVCLYTWQCE